MGNVIVKPSNGIEYVSDSTLSNDLEVSYSDDGTGCFHLCYDCDKGSYCWKSEMNK